MSQILGLLLATVMALGFVKTIVPFSEQANSVVQNAAAARSHKVFSDAVLEYSKAHYTEILAATSGAGSFTISAAMLKSSGLIDNGLNPTNSFGQVLQGQVRQDASGTLDVWTWGVGGTALVDRSTSEVAALVSAAGATAGVSPLNDSKIFSASGGVIYGSYGQFSAATAGFSNLLPGRVVTVSSITNGQVVGNYLYRNAVAGQPQLNQMNTTLTMAENDIADAGKITAKSIEASGDVKVSGKVDVVGNITTQANANASVLELTSINIENTNCPKIGQQSRDSNGLLLSCQSGGGLLQWKAAEKTQIQSGNAYTTSCDGWYWAAQYICAGTPYMDVVFAEPFDQVPQVTVTLQTPFPFTSCANGALDSIIQLATNVTRFGFRMYGGSSPYGATCGSPYSDGTATGLMSWLAIAKRP